MKSISIIVLSFCFLCIANLGFGQHDKLSTFEEMWIVSFTIEEGNNDLTRRLKGFDNPTFFSSDIQTKIRSEKDLYSIIADTPFFSIDLESGKSLNSSTSRESKNSFNVVLGERYKPGTSYKGLDSWLAVMKKGDNYTISLPVNNDEKLHEILLESNIQIVDKSNQLNTKEIIAVRIENGTY